MNFSEKLYNLRKKSGLSQEQLAENLGVSRQAISKWESGHAIPEIEKLLIISEYFQVTLDYLMKDEMKNPQKTVKKELPPSAASDALPKSSPSANIAPKGALTSFLPGMIICLAGVLCLIVWGLVSVISPEASVQISQSSMIQLDGNGIFLLISLAAIIVGAGLLLKNLRQK